MASWLLLGSVNRICEEGMQNKREETVMIKRTERVKGVTWMAMLKATEINRFVESRIVEAHTLVATPKRYLSCKTQSWQSSKTFTSRMHVRG
jgi:hypothetical protein